MCSNGHALSTGLPDINVSVPSISTKPLIKTDGVKRSTLDSLPEHIQLAIYGSLMFSFFTVHNILQESIINIPGFKYGIMLGYMEVAGVTFCSFIERRYIAKETKRVAPISEYPALTLCLLGSSALSNWSLNFINFPTKVVFRGCKLIPTMFIATLINKKSFSTLEYICALFVCLGLVMFAAADWKLAPDFNPIGLILVSLSVCADSVLPNAQERLFKLGSSRLEVTMYTNLFTLIAMTVTTFISGDLVGVIQHAMLDRTLALYMAVFTAISYIAISFYMLIIKKFGGVIAVLLGTARKAMTLVLSFLLFPKPFSWLYVYGATLILGGVLLASLYKRLKNNESTSHVMQNEEMKLMIKSSDEENLKSSEVTM
mmetsp:Transcript_30205/g.34806  ORF Transcript_30205/g.34806 Transcript_30205/m.34806 type:complete len:372 (-) Transcript_30205:116-1231(-)